jgi:hypothetical protein
MGAADLIGPLSLERAAESVFGLSPAGSTRSAAFGGC